jgi:hypothetical protein
MNDDEDALMMMNGWRRLAGCWNKERGGKSVCLSASLFLWENEKAAFTICGCRLFI